MNTKYLTMIQSRKIKVTLTLKKLNKVRINMVTTEDYSSQTLIV